jgi:hypothetical protein
VWALAGPRDGRSLQLTRLVVVGALALALIAWFVMPMFRVRQELNRCRWDDAFKFDSYGAPAILSEMFSGHLFDSGRLPAFSLAFALSTALALLSVRHALPRRLLALTGFWLMLFFGRATWGHLLLPLGIPAQFHLQRLQSAFELSAVLLTGWGLERLTIRAVRNGGAAALLAGAVLGGRY